MNWEDETLRLSADYSIDLYCNTREKIMQGGEKRQNSHVLKRGIPVH